MLLTVELDVKVTAMQKQSVENMLPHQVKSVPSMFVVANLVSWEWLFLSTVEI